MGGSERVERQHAAGKLTVRELVILESMKMEIPVESPMAGIVRELRVAEGAVVKDGDVIAVIDGN
ncbi:MAG: biotin/lipoyl-containing protein [Candidatus Binatia bacterium]